MSCSMTKYGAGSGDRIQELSIQSPMLYHYATVLQLASIGTECRRKNNIYKAIFFLHFSSNSTYKSSFYLEKTLDPLIRLMKVLNESLINSLISIFSPE